MFRTTKSIATRAAACLCFVSFATVAHAQSMRSDRLLRASSVERTVEPEISRCAFETETALIPYRLTFAEASCEAPAPSRLGAGLCRPANRLEENCGDGLDRVESELLAMGRRGETIARARANVLEILQNDNACAAWFRELNLDPAGIFQSAHFLIQEEGPRYVYGFRMGAQGELFKHPWAASTVENAGRNATIWINANGAFFNGSSGLIERDPDGSPVRSVGMRTRTLRVDSYVGNTPQAQVTMLLHEFGHILGRIPEDNDSVDGESGRNTVEVLRYCRPQVRTGAGKNHRGGS